MFRIGIMVGFLLLIAAPVACAIGSVIARRAEQHRQSARHTLLLIQALPDLGSDLPTTRVPNLSDRRLEMELLLMNLSTKAESLTAALAAEAGAGETAIADNESPQSALGRWQDARKAAAQAQESYAEAVDEFHQFLLTLPPPLRARATERGAIALAISPA
jgi:hypothetical protein